MAPIDTIPLSLPLYKRIVLLRTIFQLFDAEKYPRRGSQPASEGIWGGSECVDRISGENFLIAFHSPSQLYMGFSCSFLSASLYFSKRGAY